MHQQIYEIASQIVNTNKTKIVLADGFPGLVDGTAMLNNIKVGKGKNYLEINLTTLAAEVAFEWRAEITISTDDSYKHFLLRKDGSIVETYGKTVLDTDETDQAWLLGQLTSHQSSP